MKFKRDLRKPCAEALKEAGTHSVVPIGQASRKLDCWKCKRRRFGTTYFVEKKKKG